MTKENPLLDTLLPIATHKGQRWMLEALFGAYESDFWHGINYGHEFDREVVLEDLLTTAARQRALTPELRPLVGKEPRQQLYRLLESIAKVGGTLKVGRKGGQTRLLLKGPSFDDLGEALVKLEIQARKLPTSGGAPTDAPPKTLRKREAIQLIKEHQAELRALGVRQLSLFGSVARDEARPDSDVDFVVDFDAPVTSDRFFGTKFLLEDLLGRPVDLVTAAALREPIRAAIAAERIDVA